MSYLLLKMIHIVSSTILFGTGIGSAFYLFMANRRGELAGICFAVRHVVIADWLFTTPAVIIQFITGMLLVYELGYSFADGWVLWAVILYCVVGACWLPVVWIQIQMQALANKAQEDDGVLPERYWKLERWWVILGAVAFPLVLVIFYLMVMKPDW